MVSVHHSHLIMKHVQRRHSSTGECGSVAARIQLLKLNSTSGCGTDERAQNRFCWTRYLGLAEQKMTLTRALLSMTSFAVADVITQAFEADGFDRYAAGKAYACRPAHVNESGVYRFRSARFVSFGLLVHSTAPFYFRSKLEGALPGASAMLVVAKVLVDQVLWSPVYAVLFLSWVSIFDGKGIGSAAAKVHELFLTQVAMCTHCSCSRPFTAGFGRRHRYWGAGRFGRWRTL